MIVDFDKFKDSRRIYAYIYSVFLWFFSTVNQNNFLIMLIINVINKLRITIVVMGIAILKFSLTILISPGRCPNQRNLPPEK